MAWMCSRCQTGELAKLSLLFWVVLGGIHLLHAQTQPESAETSCQSSTVVSVPSRPTASNGADTTQGGVVEAEFGFERQWPGAGAHRDDLSGGLRLGLTPRLDLHWSS